MENLFVPGDPILVENIVSYLKAMGVFDEFRHECLADVDTKSSCQNLSQRVDGYTAKFLSNETWNPDLNKNEVRNKLRKHIDESGMLAVGADHVVEQVINPKIHQLFLPKIIEVVHQYLNKETEKLHKRQETANAEKLYRETANETTTKAKTTVLDPIADILSFTYSKPKQVTSTVQNSQSKAVDIAKVEKKKEDIQIKTPDITLKIEKKEDVTTQVKVTEPLSKIKKEEPSDQMKTAVAQSSEKKDEVLKTETIESSKESLSVNITQKNVEESKDTGKLSKELKVEECEETAADTVKKLEKDEIKLEKKKTDNLKLKLQEKLPQSDENIDIKSSSTIKTSSSKNKLDTVKIKKSKPSGSVKTVIKTGETHKSNINESSDSSSDKLSGDQSKASSKSLKPQTKEASSSLKNNISTKMVKCEKSGDSVTKSKPKPSSSKSSDKSVSLKISSSKREEGSSKVKPMSDKHDKSKSPKISDLKSDSKKHSESSLSSEKGSKNSSQYSSSYESSQGSDPDKSSSSSVSKEKLKHFSKHHKKDSTPSIDKNSSDKKQPQSDSDSGTPKKDKSTKASRPEELKKSIIVQESAKITSRSDSLASTCSSSDSQTSMKESSINTSEESSDTSSKPSDKKNLTSKDKEPCTGLFNLPPPSPPPPAPGLSMPGTSSAELSSMDDTQSPPESEESDASEDSEEDISNQSDEDSSDSNQEQVSKGTGFFTDINDVFLHSSSSSEFEGFQSSPEKNPNLEKFASDVSVSSVHTSDLSSFEDEVSEPECTSDPVEKGKSSKRFTIKEAEEILKAKAEQQRLEALKLETQKTLDNKKTSRSSIQNTTVTSSPAESEVPLLTPEPKRESRRERKLNPKYASNEYTSIFNSKRTSFITKQNEGKQAVSPDTKKTEADSVPINKRKTSVTKLDENQSSNAQSKLPSSATESVPFSEPSASKDYESLVVEYSSEDISSDLHSKTNSSDKNHNTLAESDSRSRIALKIKISASKNDNETNKVPNTHGTKRKLFEGEEKRSSKRPCHRNSLNSSSLESVANENKPLNNKSKNSSAVVNVALPNDKEVFHKQKVNNGDVLNKAEHGRKNSISKANHVNEKQPCD